MGACQRSSATSAGIYLHHALLVALLLNTASLHSFVSTSAAAASLMPHHQRDRSSLDTGNGDDYPCRHAIKAERLEQINEE